MSDWPSFNADADSFPGNYLHFKFDLNSFLIIPNLQLYLMNLSLFCDNLSISFLQRFAAPALLVSFEQDNLCSPTDRESPGLVVAAD